jgi:hypothetical protein
VPWIKKTPSLQKTINKNLLKRSLNLQEARAELRPLKWYTSAKMRLKLKRQQTAQANLLQVKSSQRNRVRERETHRIEESLRDVVSQIERSMKKSKKRYPLLHLPTKSIKLVTGVALRKKRSMSHLRLKFQPFLRRF